MEKAYIEKTCVTMAKWDNRIVGMYAAKPC